MTKRDVVQQEQTQLITQANGTGIVAIATGVGKSKITIDYINSQPSIQTVMWVVPTTNLRDSTVPEEFSKWGSRTIDLTLTCYQSLKKFDGQHFDLIVLDEGHEITSAREQYLNKINRDKLLVLTATPPHEKEKMQILYDNLKLKVICNISLEYALEHGLISDFEIIVKYVDINKVSNLEKKTRSKINDGTTGVKTFVTSEYRSYLSVSNKIAWYYEQGLTVPKYLRMHRMHMIYNLDSKRVFAANDLSKFRDTDRVLIFASNIKQAEYLCKHRYHSKTSKTDLNLFKSKQINKLSAVNALNQGENVGTVDYIYVTQVSSNPRSLVQRIGRGIRYEHGHKCKVIILVARDTIDEEWVASSLQHIDPKLITYEKNSI